MRKGQSTVFKLARGAVITVVMVLILMFLAQKIFSGTNKILDESECKKSVLAHIQMLKATSGISAPPIECPIKDETLTAKNEAEVKFQIAERMRKCWETWQEGKEALFTEKGIYCNSCYLLDFDNKDIKVENFDKYLINTKIRGEEYTYMQYLTGYTNKKDFKAEAFANNPEIKKIKTNFDTSSKKTVLFVYIKDFEEEEFEKYEGHYLATGGGALVGGTILGAAGLFCGPLSVVCVPAGKVLGAIIGGGFGSMVTSKKIAGGSKWISMNLLREYNTEELKKIGCKIAPAKQNQNT